MPIILKVTLKTVNGVTHLDVDESGNANHVPQSPATQTIQLQLEGNAAAGSFLPLSALAPSGFLWVAPAPSGTIFGSPSRSTNGNTISIPDLNDGQNSAGTWTYQLMATVNNVTYTTMATLPTGTVENPTIKNN
jgi:hypothetical protein